MNTSSTSLEQHTKRIRVMKQYLIFCVGRKYTKFSTFDKVIEHLGLMKDSAVEICGRKATKRQSIFSSLGLKEGFLHVFQQLENFK